MALTEKQKQRVDGILLHINSFLDKRFVQASHVNPHIALVEADIRWHQVETLREVLEESKWFAQMKLLVADVLSSSDEEKKRALLNSEGQVSIQNEILPDEGEGLDRRRGQLEIHDVKSLYRALEPSLEKIITLVQSWMWWDLRDASDLYRFDAQMQRLENLRHREVDAQMQEHYRREMGTPSAAVTKEDVARFEIQRLKEIVVKFEQRRQEERGYQMIVVSREREGTPEADAITVRLARRLMLMDRLRSQQTVDDAARQFYAPHLGLPSDQVTSTAIIDFEQRQARMDRQALSEQLGSSHKMGESANYKTLRLDQIRQQFDAMANSFNIAPDSVTVATTSHAASSTSSGGSGTNASGISESLME